MSLRKVLDAFSDRCSGPIEITEIASAVERTGITNYIQFVPVDMNPNVLYGIYHEFESHEIPMPYSDQRVISRILYSQHLSSEWQRLVCCKELVHIFDNEAIRTRTPTQVVGLIKNLVDREPGDVGTQAKLMAIHDELAVFQAIGLLCPKQAVKHFIEDNGPNEALFAEEFDIPTDFGWIVSVSDLDSYYQELYDF